MKALQHNPLGQWFFFDEEGQRAQLQVQTALLDGAISILVQQGLFRPTRAVLTWSEGSRPRTLDLRGLSLAEVQPRIQRAAAEVAPAASMSIQVWGDCGVLDAAGETRWLPDGLRLQTFGADGDHLSLSTWSDAFMPAALDGQPHAGVHRRNAPRLRAALEALEEVTGREIEPDDEAPRAVTQRYGLTNLTNAGRAVAPPL